MNKVVSRALWGAFFVGGLTVLGAGAAHAADTSGEDGTASGNQIGILGELPVTIGGNAISILGDSESSGSSTPAMTDASATAGSSATTGEDGIASGNQVIPDIVAPIVATGNAISVLGDSSSEGTTTSTMPTEGSTDGTTTGTTGEDGIASGNQVVPDVDAPVTVTGNNVSVIRDDMLDGGLLDGGLLDVALLDDGLLELNIIDGFLSDPVIGDSMVPTPLLGELVTEPVVDGPLLGDVDLDVLAPLAVDGTDGVDGTPGADGADGVMAPLMVTAAVTPAMMLA